jgi:hypothetical protein
MDSASEKSPRWFVTHQNQRSGPYSWRALLALASRGDLDPDAMLIKEHSERWVRARTLRALFASQQPPRTRPNPMSAAVVPRPGGAEAQDLQGLRARINALKATLTPPGTPVRGPASLESAAGADLERCETIDAPTQTMDRLAARRERPEPRVPALRTEPQPGPPAGAHRGFWDTPWLMEGLAAASISVWLGASIVLGYHMFDRMNLRGPRPASPEHVANPVPDANQ